MTEETIEPRDYSELIRCYSDDAKVTLEKLRADIDSDAIMSKLEEEYNVYKILDFNEHNIKDRLERNAFHMKDFRLKYLIEMGKYEQIKDRLEKVTGEKYIALKEGEVKLTKTEIEKYYLPKDEEILKLKALLRKQELRAEYFQAVWAAFDKTGWNMKLYAEIGKGGY